jgi:hypothetical protein
MIERNLKTLKAHWAIIGMALAGIIIGTLAYNRGFDNGMNARDRINLKDLNLQTTAKWLHDRNR